MPSEAMTTLGQSAFDFLVEEAVRVVLLDNDFNYFLDVNQDWVFRTLPDFYLGGWDDLTSGQQEDVVLELKDKVRDSFTVDY